MSNREQIKKRVTQIVNDAAFRQGYVRPIDILLQMQWLTETQLQAWRNHYDLPKTLVKPDN